MGLASSIATRFWWPRRSASESTRASPLASLMNWLLRPPTMHPDYACLAARIVVSNLHKNTKKSFSETVKIMYNHVNDRSGLEAPLIADDVYEIIMKLDDIKKMQ
ncbi:putative ribonucleoside-diphosphate reductase [Rosa chinensis]|uniref:Putative ribonucleoside-diphosphate reductase n=1 Tax=Rosa chinensis TaxID=74649 RepID=A0A2P6QP45_ROSCH|nr:putative ribonucleoside-diphosphate reductase [Rosa chinensis]